MTVITSLKLDELLIAAVVSLFGVAVALSKMVFTQQNKRMTLLLKQGEMVGKTTLLLEQIPQHLEKIQEEQRQLIRDFQSSISNCRLSQERMKNLTELLKMRSGNS